MHESGLTRDLLAQIKRLAEEAGADTVTCVSVWLGALSHMSPEHFKYHFDQEAGGSMAENARLDIETSDDIYHPQAQSILLRSIDVAEP